jgi:hypothetical protein
LRIATGERAVGDERGECRCAGVAAHDAVVAVAANPLRDDTAVLDRVVEQ